MLSDADLAALPEVDTRSRYETRTDPMTGECWKEYVAARFMVRDADALFYTDAGTGDRWQVVRDIAGNRFKERV